MPAERFVSTARAILRTSNNLIPYFIRIRLDAEEYGITEFMKQASKKVKKSDVVLDAGAGSCPYKKHFSHARYQSTDIETPLEGEAKHDFACNLENIPKPNNSYDVIVNTQVLEHVEHPQKVINELHRILKPGGKLFLTAPQSWGIHGEPHHYFNFTKYGLELLFKNAGFKIIYLKPRGGMFWYLADRIKKLPRYILKQHLILKKDNSIKLNITPLSIILTPICLLAMPLCEFLIPLLFFHLDFLDKKQDYTLGYACYCKK
ncbi:MAG: methyltransferase domain-containing protein [Candidatus Altiarchaeales archaeon]|nr:methyltransferase domain-containing protein [Candidatus Altiarchaeales archaeon]